MTLSSRSASAAANASEFGREDALRDAVVVAQVDEQQVAVIALAMHPAGQRDTCWPTCSGRSSSFVCVRYLLVLGSVTCPPNAC